MNSWVVLCNMALTRLGEDNITALSDSSVQAIACNIAYLPVVDEVLTAYDWVCSRETAQLAASLTIPTYKWKSSYLLPASPYCLRVREVLNLGEEPIPYHLKGRSILCDDPDGIFLGYNKRMTVPADIDPLLASAMSLRLASWIEPQFGDSIMRRKSILEEYDVIILQAKMSGAIQDYSQDELERSADAEYGNSDWARAGR